MSTPLTPQDQAILDQIAAFVPPAGTPMNSPQAVAVALDSAVPGWRDVVGQRAAWATLASFSPAAGGYPDFWRALVDVAGGGLVLRFLEKSDSRSAYEQGRGTAATFWFGDQGLQPGNELWRGYPVDHSFGLLSKRWREEGAGAPQILYKMGLLGACAPFAMPGVEPTRAALQDVLARLLAPFGRAGYLTDLTRLDPCVDREPGAPQLPRIGYVLTRWASYKERDPLLPVDGLPELPEPDPLTGVGRFDIERRLAYYSPWREEIVVHAPEILACAKRLKVEPAILLLVVLTHELGHWLMHKLHDAEARVWDTERYDESDTYLHEGWAQLMTTWVAEELGGDFLHCFEALGRGQSAPYHAYRAYLDQPRDRVVASLALMRQLRGPVGLTEWDATLALARPVATACGAQP